MVGEAVRSALGWSASYLEKYLLVWLLQTLFLEDVPSCRPPPAPPAPHWEAISSGFSSRLYPCRAAAACCCESRNHSRLSLVFLPISLVASSPFPGPRPLHSLPASWRSWFIKRTCRSAPVSRRIGGKTMCHQRRPPRGGRRLVFPPLVPLSPWRECFCHLTTVSHFSECPDTDRGGDWIGTHSHLLKKKKLIIFCKALFFCGVVNHELKMRPAFSSCRAALLRNNKRLDGFPSHLHRISQKPQHS